MDAINGKAPQAADALKMLQEKYGEKDKKQREPVKALGKDDFLKIMITQMKNQDPTNPFKAEQFATELAQFTSVEQLQNMNRSLDKMGTQHKPLEKMALSNLIGKSVSVDPERFVHQESEPSNIRYELGQDAKDVTISIHNENGEQVYQKEIGAKTKGSQQFRWEGLNSLGQKAKSGNFLVKVKAKDAAGQEIKIPKASQAQVVGVSFDGGEPTLLVGEIGKAQKVSFQNVTRIEETKAKTPVVSNAQTNAVTVGSGVPGDLAAAAIANAAAASAPAEEAGNNLSILNNLSLNNNQKNEL